MAKFIVFTVGLLFFLGCRKDSELPISNVPNPCSDSTKPYCLFPNAVDDSVSIFISITKHAGVKMTYFDRYGNEIAQILDSSLVKGGHLFTFDATILPMGLNMCKIDLVNETYWAKILKL